MGTRSLPSPTRRKVLGEDAASNPGLPDLVDSVPVLPVADQYAGSGRVPYHCWYVVALEITNHGGGSVARRANYGFEKRQREIKKQKKKEAKAEKKRLMREAARAAANPDELEAGADGDPGSVDDDAQQDDEEEQEDDEEELD
jgi:hypothetical protein